MKKKIVIGVISSFLRIKNIINQGQLLYNMLDYTGEDVSNKSMMQNADVFCIFGEETPVMLSTGDIITVPKGNAIDKFNMFVEICPGDSSDAQQIVLMVIDYINNNLTEITKEEYESLITQ